MQYIVFFCGYNINSNIIIYLVMLKKNTRYVAMGGRPT